MKTPLKLTPKIEIGIYVILYCFALLLLMIDVFLLERKTGWINKLNLFNEKKA